MTVRDFGKKVAGAFCLKGPKGAAYKAIQSCSVENADSLWKFKRQEDHDVEDRAPVGTNLSTIPGVVNEARVVAVENPSSARQFQHVNDPNPPINVSISR